MRQTLWSPASFRLLYRRFTQESEADAKAEPIARSVFDAHKDRLEAYKFLTAVVDNCARGWLLDEAVKAERREFGDGGLIVEVVAGSVIGDSQSVSINDVKSEKNPENADIQAFMDKWATDESLRLKMLTVHRDAAEYGDGVFVLGWDAEKKRVRLHTYNPGFYFPDLDSSEPGDYPTAVHVAWEEVDDSIPDRPVDMIRRRTWELRRTAKPVAYPWGESNWACFMTDATWRVEDVNPKFRIEKLPYTYARFATDANGIEIRDVNLGIDFIPVIHMPQSATGEHYGRSALLRVLQILEELAATDSDLALTARTTGFPVVTLSGTRLDGGKSPTYKPGKIWELGENGRMDVLHTSDSLIALLSYADKLLDRLSINARIPQAALGRIDPSQVPSGMALALGFAPMSALVRECRLIADEKYALLLKMVFRMSQAGAAVGLERTWAWPGGSVTLGAYLPNDMTETITNVCTMLDHKIISRETAMTILRAAGVEIIDVKKELEKVRATDFASAAALMTAVGDPIAVAAYLRLQDEYQIAVKPPAPPPATGAPGPANPSPTAQGAPNGNNPGKA